MRRTFACIALTALLAFTGGCTAACPTGKLVELLKQDPKPTAALARLATEAQSDAAKQSDPKNKVSCLRVAAVAAWQSESDSLVGPITLAGTNACDALPQKDADAPTDCTEIRVAQPMAIQDGVSRSLEPFAARITTPPPKFPAADFATLKQDFDDLEAQYAKVTAIRHGADGLSVPPEVKTRLDRYRLIITCNAISAWAFSGLCIDAPVADFNQMATRKQQMIQGLGLTTTQVTEKCKTTPGVAAPE